MYIVKYDVHCIGTAYCIQYSMYHVKIQSHGYLEKVCEDFATNQLAYHSKDVMQEQVSHS